MKNLFFLVLTGLSIDIMGATITDGRFLTYKTLTLENKYIKAIIAPELNGMILSYYHKPSKTEYLHPYQEQAKEVSPLLELTGKTVEHNSGGYKDWVWGTPANNSIVRYDWEIIERGPKVIAIELQRKPDNFQALTLRKIIRLEEDSTILENQIYIENQTDSPYFYWGHGMINIGGMFNYDVSNFIPLQRFNIDDKNIEANRLDKRLQRAALVEKAGVINRQVTMNVPSLFVLPSSNWWAVANPARKIIIGQIFSSGQLEKEHILLHCYCGKIWDNQSGSFLATIPMMTQEIIFPPVNPGSTAELQIDFVAIHGLTAISMINSFIAISTKRLNSKELVVSIASLKALDEARIEIYQKETLLAAAPLCNNPTDIQSITISAPEEEDNQYQAILYVGTKKILSNFSDIFINHEF